MWAPLNFNELQELLTEGENELETSIKRLWSLIRIPPTKWQQHPWGDEGNGFWVVGVIGTLVIWYNDIEYGFNISTWSTFGVIDEYWCNQDELCHAVSRLYSQLFGEQTSGNFGAPETNLETG